MDRSKIEFMENLNDEAVLKYIDTAISSRTETHKVEFKDARGGTPGDLWEPISAFCNCPGGGMIVFGVHEDRDAGTVQVVGGLDLATLQEKIVSYLNDLITNPGRFSLRIVSHSGHQLLVLLLAETDKERKPCCYKRIGLPHGACIREGNTNRRISEEEMRTFIRYSANYRFDASQAVDTDLEMLSEDKIRAYLEKSAEKVGRRFVDIRPPLKVLKNQGIVGEFEGEVTPTIAGYLIFSKSDPQSRSPFSRYEVRCVRYAGTSAASPIVDKHDVKGCLDVQIEGVLKFILRNIAMRARLVGAKRVETYEYPEEALREIVANAIIHRDYMVTGTYIQVNIFSNRIDVSNPGNLPPGITVQNIKDSQFSRNEIIAGVLRNLDYMEEFGRGIDLVYSKMQEWELVAPLFKNSSNSFKVTLLGGSFKGLNERQLAIWHYLQDNKTITAKHATSLFDVVSRASVNGDLREMVKMGLVVARGSSSNTFYEPKY